MKQVGISCFISFGYNWLLWINLKLKDSQKLDIYLNRLFLNFDTLAFFEDCNADVNLSLKNKMKPFIWSESSGDGVNTLHVWGLTAEG